MASERQQPDGTNVKVAGDEPFESETEIEERPGQDAKGSAATASSSSNSNSMRDAECDRFRIVDHC